MDVIKSQQISSRPIEKVIVHPLVLLSIVDNYNRVAKDTRKRVVGVLLGSSFKGTVDVTNSYAGLLYLNCVVDDLPFEEDDKDPSIWFLDHNYHESMFSMFKRINAKEHVVGWYSTGPKLRENDLDIHGLFTDYVPNPVLVIIDVQPKELGIPTKAYYAVEEVKEDVFNLLPNLNVAELIKAFAVKTNDQMLVIYLSSLIRSVIALHNLINNKMLNKEHEKAEDSKPAAVAPVAGS
ncbi:hypothetical protein LguiB_015557 [Lonicera macranthoides]